MLRIGQPSRARRITGWVICGGVWFVAVPLACCWMFDHPLDGITMATTYCVLVVGAERLARRRPDRRRCACGYDLRATPDRCPECGRLNDPQVVYSG